MTLKSIIFCKLEINSIKKVIERLKDIPQIKKIMSVTGDYDVIVEIETQTSEDLYEIFSNQIDLIEGIIDTNTDIILKSWEK